MHDVEIIGKKKKMGIGAVFSVLKRYLHSRKDVDIKYPNATQRDWLEGILVVDQGVIKVNHKDQVYKFFWHDDFPNQHLHCVELYAKVITEGGVTDFFDNTEEESTAAPMENE